MSGKCQNLKINGHDSLLKIYLFQGKILSVEIIHTYKHILSHQSTVVGILQSLLVVENGKR